MHVEGKARVLLILVLLLVITKEGDWEFGCWNMKRGHQLQRGKPITVRAKEKETRTGQCGRSAAQAGWAGGTPWETRLEVETRAWALLSHAMGNAEPRTEFKLGINIWTLIGLEKGQKTERERDHCAFSDLGDQEMNPFNPWNEIKRYFGSKNRKPMVWEFPSFGKWRRLRKYRQGPTLW